MHRFVNDGEFEHSEEHHSTAAGMAAVEAEHELVEVVRKVSPVHGALVGTQQPSLGQRSDPVYPGQECCGILPADPGCPLAARLVDVSELVQPAVALPAVSDDRRSLCDEVCHEGMQ